jgi:hypothetical protein
LVKGESRKKVRLGPGHFGLRYLFCLEGATGTASSEVESGGAALRQSRRYVSASKYGVPGELAATGSHWPGVPMLTAYFKSQ